MDDQRRAFVARAILGEQSISELCREYGISRLTGYKWIERQRPFAVRFISMAVFCIGQAVVFLAGQRGENAQPV